MTVRDYEKPLPGNADVKKNADGLVPSQVVMCMLRESEFSRFHESVNNHQSKRTCGLQIILQLGQFHRNSTHKKLVNSEDQLSQLIQVLFHFSQQ